MSMDTDWQVCVDPRKQKRKQRRIEQDQCPHLVRPEKAQYLERKLNVDNLATALLCERSRELQQQGWIYTRVLRPEDIVKNEEGWEYTIIDDFNKWGDKLLYRREISQD